MTFYFFDTSAYVKALACEPGERRVRELINGAAADPPRCRVVVCDFVLPETVSALQQRRDRKDITRKQYEQAAAEVERHATGEDSPFVVIEGSGVMVDSMEIVRRHQLRPGDALHLAAALAARAAIPAGHDFCFVTADEKQENAARAEGFAVLVPAA